MESPPDGLRRPGRDAVGQIEHRRRAFGRRQDATVCFDGSAVGRQHAAETFEQRRLTGTVGADEAEHLARPDGKGHLAERGEVSVSFGEVADVEQQTANVAARRRLLPAAAGWRYQ